jgi:hypothetical protein
MSDMYGKRDPAPLPPCYSAEDLRAMRAREEREALEARQGDAGAFWRRTLPSPLG